MKNHMLSRWSSKLLVCAVFSLFYSCIHQPDKDTNRTVSPYVIALPSENQSADASLRVEFSQPIEALSPNGDLVKEEVFRFKPDIKGKTYRQGASALLFQPDEPMVHGQEYQVSINLDKLFQVDEEQESSLQFSFHVIPLTLSLSLEQLSPYHIDNTEWNYLRGSLAASDKIKAAALEQIVTATQEARQLSIKWLDSSTDGDYQFIIDSIHRGPETSEIVIKMDGAEAGSEDQLEKSYVVPSSELFELSNARVVLTPDQYIELQFSDPIDHTQNLDGLIYFNDQSALRLTVNKNTVLVYPESQQSGEQQLVIKKSIRNKKGRQLENDIIKSLYFSQLKPEVRFTDPGVIMPGSEGWILPFEAVNLSHVDVYVFKIYAENMQQFLQVNQLTGDYQLRRVGQLVHKETIRLIEDVKSTNHNWASYAIDLSNMIRDDQGALYRIQFRFKKAYALYDCGNQSDVDEESADMEEVYEDGDLYEEDYYEDYYYPSGYRWYDRNDPCTISYYSYEHFVAKNALASNIGLIVKNDGKDTYKVFVNELTNNKSIGGVSLQLFDYQQQLIASSKTASNGEAMLSCDKKPWLLLARKDKQFAYLRMDGGSALSYSKFDTKGSENASGLKGFIYGDRGVWRPGDTLFLTLIVDDQENKLPENHPATLKLVDPRGKELSKKTILKGVNGFYTFKMTTPEDAFTGLWKAVAEVGGAVFEKRLRIENVKPNRLKVALSFNEKILAYGSSRGKLHTQWLHGGKAAGLEVDIQATIRSTPTIFEGYASFVFDDASKYFSPEERHIYTGKVNAEGDADFELNLPRIYGAPGMLTVNFVTKVFEKGGDFSTNQESAAYASYDHYVGISVPEVPEGSDYLEVDRSLQCKVVSLSKEGKPAPNRSLQVEVYRLDWSWWYSRNNARGASYISYSYDQRVFNTTVRTNDQAEASFDFTINYPSWGWFYVVVKDNEGDHSAGKRIYIDWPSSYARDQRKAVGDAQLLSLSCDKSTYNVGDTVRISLPTPENSRILISLEKNDKILRSWWMDGAGEESLIEFIATADMAPNIYAYASVLQPHKQSQNDLPIRMYGLLPVFIENQATILHPVLSLPPSIRPETNYQIEVSEKNGRGMTYTIAVVDEGLLDLTRFKTPDPHAWFYAREALAVHTWDIYDKVMGAFGGRLQQLFAIGGGAGEEVDQGKKKANRFKSVVSFIGPFTLAPGDKKQHQLRMPNYVGSVRCMLVAANEGAYGASDQTVAVKQPLMVLATLPRILAPGEKLSLPVSVFAMENQIKKVGITLRTNELLNAPHTSEELVFKSPGEKMATFELDVADKQGVATLEVVATSGDESAFYSLEVEVRNPNERVYSSEHYRIKNGEKRDLKPEFPGMQDSHELNLSVSDMPAINLEKRLNQLIRYPYGCLEQTTSSVFPQLYLSDLLQLTDQQESDIETNVRKGISRISKNQLSSGGFSYWPGGNSAADWATTYAGHFLLLAKEKGYLVSAAMLNKWLSYQNNMANKWVPRLNQKGKIANDLMQAYRLYTLALAGSPNTSAMNRLAEQATSMYPTARYRLAAAYALMNQLGLAKKILQETDEIIEVPDNYWYYNYGSEVRDKAMVLETMLLLDDDRVFAISQQIADALKEDRWMSTQTTAFSLYAMALLSGGSDPTDTYAFNYTWNDEASGEIIPEAPIFSKNLMADGQSELHIENKGQKDIYVTITTSGIPEPGETVDHQKNLKLKVSYRDMNHRLIDISRLTHGFDFYAIITVENPRWQGYQENMALSQVFPSGWEIINTRMLDLGAELSSSAYDFMDIRDDRVNFFFNIKGGEKKSFVVLLNAAYLGNYYLPPTQCQAMYNNEISATVGGEWVAIIKADR